MEIPKKNKQKPLVRAKKLDAFQKISRAKKPKCIGKNLAQRSNKVHFKPKVMQKILTKYFLTVV